MKTTTITEDYVSLEIAKLLKECGFNEECWEYYASNGNLRSFRITKCNYDNIPYKNAYIAPTHQTVLKWLREVYEECIIVYPIVTDDDGSAGCLWQYSISKLLATQHKSAYAYEFYEQACEAAIKHCLINLI